MKSVILLEGGSYREYTLPEFLMFLWKTMFIPTAWLGFRQAL